MQFLNDLSLNRTISPVLTIIYRESIVICTRPFNAKELTEFLRTPELLVHPGTIDESGAKLSKMIRNLEKNKTISFCIDNSRPDQYKGVRGKGDVSIHEDVEYTAVSFHCLEVV